MAILVNDTTPRAQYTATASQTKFAYPFEIFEDADLKVYQTLSGATPDDTADLLTLTTDYTVTNAGVEGGGNVVLVTGASVGDTITIERDIAVKRTTDYQNLGDLASSSLNNDLDKLVMMVQQNEASLGRGLFLSRSTKAAVPFSLDEPIAGYIARAKSDLTGVEWVTPNASAGGVSLSSQANLAGLSLKQFTDIPTGTARFDVVISGLNLPSAGNVEIRLGTSGVVATSGYASTANAKNVSGDNFLTSVSGFVIVLATGTSGENNYSRLSFNLTGAANQWIMDGTSSSELTGANASYTPSAGNSKSVLTGALDVIEINGLGQTITSGSINILYYP